MRYKTQTEGWLPGEAIQGISLYARIGPKAIIEDCPQKIEFIWIVRFGRHMPLDPLNLVRTTQEFWINARTGFVRAILPPGKWPITQAPGAVPDAHLEGAMLRQAQVAEEAIRKDLTRRLPLYYGPPAGNGQGRSEPQLLALMDASPLPPAKPFASTDFLLTFTDLSVVEYEEGIEKNYSLGPREQALFDELKKSKVPNAYRLARLLITDAQYSEDDGVLVRCMTGTTTTLRLIRLGRDVDGFGQEGDLVWIAGQAFGPVIMRIVWEQDFRKRPCPWAPYLYRQVWVNAKTGKMFSVLSTDPDEKIKPLQNLGGEDLWSAHREWTRRCKESFAKLKIEDRAWLTYWRKELRQAP